MLNDKVFILTIVFCFFVPLLFGFYLMGKAEGVREVCYDIEDYLKEKCCFRKDEIEDLFRQLCRIRKIKNKR